VKPAWFKKRVITVTSDAERECVKHVQRVLSLEETGELDPNTQSKIRGVQYIFGLRPTGILDEATAEEIDRIFPYGA
jgi:peptidoglycan hydrolase-like protein with peptidoglycan-binding domain